MKLSSVLLWLSLATAAAGCWRVAERSRNEAPRPKKVLLITIDTTRADHLSSYGYPRATTPAIDGLAAAGVRFANAYSVMPTTDPSHASMLTCQYPRTHGIMRNAARRSDGSAPSFATWLQDRGYLTAAITARIGLDPRLRRIRGFDHSDAPRLPVRHRSAREIVERCGRWMSDRDERPWFLWAHLWEPHKPYEPEPPYRGRFSAQEAPRKRSYGNPPRFLPAGKTLADEIVHLGVALYDGELAAADAAVAQIVGLARRARPPGEPLVAIVADHGESLADRQRETRIGFGHGALIYDEVVKVPWIVWWPGRVGQAVIETPVSLVDLAPTLAGLIADEAMPGCEGRSLATNVLDGSNPEHAPIVIDRRLFESHPIANLRYAETAWIDYPWKLIVNEGPGRPELYRLDEDSGETRDLAIAEPGRVRALGSRLARWKHERPLRSDDGPRTREHEQELEALRSLGYID